MQWPLLKSTNFRAIHKLLHLGGAMSLVEVENMATVQSCTLGGSGGILNLIILGVLRHILETYREAHTKVYILIYRP